VGSDRKQTYLRVDPRDEILRLDAKPPRVVRQGLAGQRGREVTLKHLHHGGAKHRLEGIRTVCFRSEEGGGKGLGEAAERREEKAGREEFFFAWVYVCFVCGLMCASSGLCIASQCDGMEMFTCVDRRR
jgi:hypothetical protein